MVDDSKKSKDTKDTKPNIELMVDKINKSRDSLGPQLGHHAGTLETINSLNMTEFNKVGRILDIENKQKNVTILDMPLGKVINNTMNFFGNSVDTYYGKLIEAEVTQDMYETDNDFLKNLQKHLLAIVLFIRDEDNVIYLGIIMIILSVLICFFNISRSYGNSGSGEVATKS